MHKCLQSVLRQGLSSDEYECLLINDGSTDNSRDICEEYVQKHPNFKLIDQKNQGVAVARNTGIDNAQGEFVCFLDSDDYFLDDGLAKAFLLFASKKEIDVIHYYSDYDFWPKREIHNEIDHEGDAYELILQGGLPSFCWVYIYRKSFLTREHIRFKEWIFGEDQAFSSTVMLANPKVLSSRANIYRYVVRSGTATTKKSAAHTRICVDHYIQSYEEIIKQMEHYHLHDKSEVEKACIDSINSKKRLLIGRIWSSEYDYSSFKTIHKRIKRNSFLPIRTWNNGVKTKCLVWAMNFSMSSYITYKVYAFLYKHIVEPRLKKQLLQLKQN